MPVRATVLVALDETRVAACDQKARRRGAREVVIQCQVRPRDVQVIRGSATRTRREGVGALWMSRPRKISSKWLKEPTCDRARQNVAGLPFG